MFKRVITYGTYDLLHWGHINLLRRAKQLGDYLIVGLSSDAFNEGKGKKAFHDFEVRKKMLEAVRYVDLVIAEDNWDQKSSDIGLYQADVLVMGSDWKNKFNELNSQCEVVYLERTQDISTSQISQEIIKNHQNYSTNYESAKK